MSSRMGGVRLAAVEIAATGTAPPPGSTNEEPQ
jgi:hypothetical protein